LSAVVSLLLSLYFLGFLCLRLPPASTLFPYTTLFRSQLVRRVRVEVAVPAAHRAERHVDVDAESGPPGLGRPALDVLHTIKRRRDRKSTRLNSSHVKISYAVFCLKKKNRKISRAHVEG